MMISAALIVAIIVALLCSWAAYHKLKRPYLHILTWYLAFHWLVFVIRPVVTYSFGWHGQIDYMLFSPSADDVSWTSIASTLFLVIFTASYISFAPKSIQIKLHPLTSKAMQAFYIVFVLLMPLTLYSTVRMFSVDYTQENTTAQIFGVDDTMEDALLHTGQTAYITMAYNFLVPLAILLIIVRRFDWISLAFVALVAGTRLFLGWERWGLIVLVFAICISYATTSTTKLRLGRILVVLLPVVATFAFLSENRDFLKEAVGMQPASYASTPEGRSLEGIARWVDGPDLAGFDFATYIVAKVPKETRTYSYFLQHLELFTRPIPRVLWSGKPVGPPVPFFNLSDYGNFRGRSPTIVGDGWMSAGFFGVAVNATVYGLLFGWLGRLVNAKNNIYWSIFHVFLLALAFQFFRDGDILSLLRFGLWMFVPIVFWRWTALLLTHQRPRLPSKMMTSGRALS
ncbi:O-antigen polymerase [Microvirga aerophila]|uniref:O-antigen polymerase n=1 Tax=Microvirga aerophila TaxID=670291 RepID=UPI000DEFAD19|nr:O-antigen polymerase [Microvirga aerophila]